MRGDTVLPLIIPKSEGDIGLFCVKPLLLECIRLYLVDKPDTAPLLPEINEQPRLCLPQGTQRCNKLVMAVAPQGAEDIAGQAFRVEPYHHVLLVDHIAMDKGSVLFIVTVVEERHCLKLAVLRREVCHSDSPDTDLVPADPLTLLVFILLKQTCDIFLCQTHNYYFLRKRGYAVSPPQPWSQDHDRE